MKYKQLYLQQQREIEERKLLYVLLKAMNEKQAAKEVIKESEPKATESPMIEKGNKKTVIHVITTYSNIEELHKGMGLASKVANLNIVDEVNIEIPIRLIK